MIKNNEGRKIEEEDQVRQLFIENDKKLFALHDIGQRWEQTYLTFPCIDQNIMEKLGKSITDNEIRHVMFYMTPWKVSGLDGFPTKFYQKSWSVTSRKVCEHVKGLW
ncbi:unnamed protein product [Lathyrus oleraceus]